MNEVPLIQNVQKNDINTSIIAIKKQLKQLIEAVGLIESPNSPDMSPYVKKTDIVDYVQIGNQNPVTSNGVYVALTELEERIDENIVDNVENGDLRPVTSNAVSQSLSYSTTEQKTGGVWIDGKPIYRNVINFTGSITANAWSWGGIQSTITALNIDVMVSATGVDTTIGYFRVFNFNKSNGFSTANGIGSATSYFILEYTKTTDN